MEDRAFCRDIVVNHAAAALHIRDIGAEDFFTFRRKTQVCTEHMNQHAAEAGMPPVDEIVDALTKELSHGYELTLKETRAGLQYWFGHPVLSTWSSGVIQEKVSRPQLAQDLARWQAHRLVSGLTRSVWLSREVHGALGQSALRSSKVLAIPSSERPSAPDVAVTLRLPAIEGASAEQLLLLRREEPDEFDIFRGALAKTIEERIKALPHENADRVGRSVVEMS